MTIKNGDFIEIEYTGKVKEDDIVFDTTDEKVAKEHHLHSHSTFGPVTICVGQAQVLPGIDKHLEGKDVGKEYSLDIGPEDAFGKKEGKLIQMIPTKKFREQKIEPQPGLQVNIDGIAGTIKTVSGGRVLMDFNHPLAGRELSYQVKVNKQIQDPKQKLHGFMKLTLGMDDFVSEINDGKANITLKMELPEQARDELSKKITSVIPEIKQVTFSTAQEAKK